MEKKKILVSLLLDSAELMANYEWHIKNNLRNLQLALCKLGENQNLTPDDILISCTTFGEDSKTTDFIPITEFKPKFYTQTSARLVHFYQAFITTSAAMIDKKQELETLGFNVQNVFLTFVHNGNFFGNTKLQDRVITFRDLLPTKDNLDKNNINFILIEFGNGRLNVAKKYFNLDSNYLKEKKDDYAPFDNTWYNFQENLLLYLKSDKTLVDNFFNTKK